MTPSAAALWLNTVFAGFDAWGLSALHAVQQSGADVVFGPLARMMALLGQGGIFLLVLGAALCCFRKTRKTGLAMLLAVGLGFLVTNVLLKPLIYRPRPYADESRVFYRWWLEAGAVKESDRSFPSGHVTVAMTSATAFFRTGAAGKRWPVFFFPLLMALSRCYLMVHYPSDVLAGLLVGLLTGSLAAWLISWLSRGRGTKGKE